MSESSPHGAPLPGTAPDPVRDAQARAEDSEGISAGKAEAAEVEATENGHGHSSVLDSLRTLHAARTEDRRKVLMIVPGRYRSILAARCKPVAWNDQRRKVRKMQAQGDSEETELNYGAGVIADACEEILIRPETGAALQPMHEVVAEFAGQEPVRFDGRLAKALGIDAQGLSPVEICRLVFDNPSALNAYFAELDAWLKEATEDDEDEDGADRPT